MYRNSSFLSRIFTHNSAGLKPGSNSFTYFVRVTGETDSDTATVTLTACTEDFTQIFACWKESAYRAMLEDLGYGTFLEGFEGAEWDTVRSTFNTTNSAAEITSQGMTWTSNHPDPPAENPITTGSGAAATGAWGLFDPLHGYSSFIFAQCDPNLVGEPLPPECFLHDGFRGAIETGGASLHGVGGYIDAIAGGNIDIILDGAITINFGQLPNTAYQFFGVIDNNPAGFSGFEFR